MVCLDKNSLKLHQKVSARAKDSSGVRRLHALPARRDASDNGAAYTEISTMEEPDVTYAGGFPEDYSDVFGAPAAALPAF